MKFSKKEIKDLNYIADNCLEFFLETKGGWYNKDMIPEVMDIPIDFANDLLESVSKSCSMYFWGWDDNTGFVRFYYRDVVNQLNNCN